MPNMRHHFSALLSKIEPKPERRSLVSTRCGEIRDYLKEHDYETENPHTRLVGSCARATAIDNIADVDSLVFVKASQLDRSPNAVLMELLKVLRDFPGGKIDATGQRRSVRIVLPDDEIEMDVVPAIALGGIDEVLRVPDRPQANWICSDPLNYAVRLSTLNSKHSCKVVPLIKLLKAWRNEQMNNRRPKSYVLEVIVLYAVESGELGLVGKSFAENVRDLLNHIAAKYSPLMDEGSESPRIRDPQVTNLFITKGWQRSHFETFMRRIRESATAAKRAVDAADEETANTEWQKVFGTRWPTLDEVKAAAKLEAQSVIPGSSKITPAGRVIEVVGAGLPTLATRYDGTV